MAIVKAYTGQPFNFPKLLQYLHILPCYENTVKTTLNILSSTLFTDLFIDIYNAINKQLQFNS